MFSVYEKEPGVLCVPVLGEPGTLDAFRSRIWLLIQAESLAWHASCPCLPLLVHGLAVAGFAGELFPASHHPASREQAAYRAVI